MKIMKKLIPLLIIPALLLILAPASSASYFTYDPEKAEETTEEDLYSAFEDALPEDIKNTVGDIFSPDASPADDPWTSVAESALSALGESIAPAFADLSVIVGVLIISAVWRNMNGSISEGEENKTFSFLVRCVLCLVIMKTQTDVFLALSAFSTRLCTVCSAFIPAMSAVYLASGNVTSSILNQSGLAMLITLAENLFAFFILPAMKASCALSCASCVTEQKAPVSIAAFLRNSAAFISCALMTVFSFIFSLRLKVGESADGAIMKTVRFAVGSFVPVVGGAVSDSLGHVGASVSFIKASCGSAAIAVILILLLPTLFGLIMNRCVLFVSKHLSAALSLEEEEGFLSELGAGATLSIAYAVCVSVMFVICMALFVKSGVAAR